MKLFSQCGFNVILNMHIGEKGIISPLKKKDNFNPQKKKDNFPPKKSKECPTFFLSLEILTSVETVTNQNIHLSNKSSFIFSQAFNLNFNDQLNSGEPQNLFLKKKYV